MLSSFSFCFCWFFVATVFLVLLWSFCLVVSLGLSVVIDVFLMQENFGLEILVIMVRLKIDYRQFYVRVCAMSSSGI